jgi:CHAT domain-containing protein
LADAYDLLIAPLADALEGAGRLIIVPHGTLHALPFHALCDGRSHLCERFEISRAPSASVLATLPSPRAEDRRPRALVLGVPDARAPRIEQEIEAVARALPGARVHVGAGATRRCLREGAPDADLVHLACHGIYLRDNPLASGLKLADGWMTVRDLFGLKLPGSVVVLSGCETGQLAVRGGDELLGLAQGFLAAGASAVLMTLWALHDETAEILVASLYEFWHTGHGGNRSLAAALRNAQRKVMDLHPHPAFWAPFIQVGHP